MSVWKNNERREKAVQMRQTAIPGRAPHRRSRRRVLFLRACPSKSVMHRTLSTAQLRCCIPLYVRRRRTNAALPGPSTQSVAICRVRTCSVPRCCKSEYSSRVFPFRANNLQRTIPKAMGNQERYLIRISGLVDQRAALNIDDDYLWNSHLSPALCSLIASP